MPEKELPADWMIERALELMVCKTAPLETVKKYPRSYRAIINVAHYIGEHEAAPADSDLLLAREAAATCGWNDCDAYGFLAGENDHVGAVKGALRAIKLARERGAL